MNKVSRLAALLLAVLLFAFAGCALAEEGETVQYTGTETNISLTQLLGIAQSEASLNLYNDFMKAETVAAMATAIRNACNDKETDYISLMQEFTAEQIAALVARAEELYQLDPSEDNLTDLEEIKDILYKLQNGSEAMALATTWSGTVAGGNLTQDVTLTGNVKLTNNITIPAGSTVTIDLNGFILQGNGNGSVITNNGTLTIIDSNPDSAHKGTLKERNWVYGYKTLNKTANNAIWEYDNSGNVTINGGIIYGGKVKTDDNDANAGTAALALVKEVGRLDGGGGIDNDGTLYLKGGTIAGCEVLGGYYGGGIHTGPTSSLVIDGGSVKYNWCNAHVGGVYSYGGDITFKSGHIDDNKCGGSGGGLRADNAGTVEPKVTMTGGTISRNWALGDSSETGNGGGVYSEKGQLDFQGGTISYNVSYNRGGGIDIWNSGEFTLGSGCKVIGNEAGYSGGGLSVAMYSASDNKLTMTIAGGEVSENKAPQGGGISIIQGNLTLNSGMISGNTATTDVAWVNKEKLDKGSLNTQKGGGAFIDNGDATISGGTISSNGSAHDGGGLYVNGGTLTISGDNARVTGNTATRNGGAAYVSERTTASGDGHETDFTGAEVTMNSGLFENNTAQNGGALYITVSAADYVGKFTLNGGIFEGNKATENGGAVYMNNGEFTMNGGSIIGNGKNAESAVVTQNGGAAYINGGKFAVTSGTIDSNGATANGGGVYVTGGTVTIGDESCTESHSHPVLSNNTAVDGGAIYVNGQTPTMHCGTLSSNSVTGSGGAVYVNGGGFEMNDGLLDDNEAATNGGAVYVTGGGFMMYDGDLTNNDAVNGGAVYVTGTGSSFTMISGSMTNNAVTASSAAAAEAGEEGYGGALYIKGGDVKIGIEGCDGTTDTHTTTDYTDKAHPVIEENTAEFGGALAVSGGNVYVYCGDVTSNVSDNRGTGENVFMDGGAFHHYLESSNIGNKEDHGMVSIGGELTIHHGENQQFIITIKYHANADLGENVEVVWEGTAPKDYYLNLPYCPTEWQNKQNEQENPMTFAGWVQSQEGTTPEKIRAKDDYSPIGTPIKIEDMSSNQAKEMYFYAVWAPKYNPITYAYTLDGINILESLDYTSAGTTKLEGEKHAGKEYYQFSMTRDTVDIGIPSIPGYSFLGWRIHATKAHISNWDADAKNYPVSKLEHVKEYADYSTYNGIPNTSEDYVAPIFISTNSYLPDNMLNTQQSFGDITLVAVFEPAFSGLIINKSGAQGIDDDQTFIFNVHGIPYDGSDEFDIKVVIKGDGQAIVRGLPVGDYTVTELTDWSWRYQASGEWDQKNPVQVETYGLRSNNSSASVDVALTLPTQREVVNFTNTRNKVKWLDGAAYEENTFNGVTQ